MVRQFRAETITDVKFKLFSVVALLRKMHDGITIEELYRSVERKFYTLIELLSDKYRDDTILSSVEFSLEDLKEGSLLMFDRLISNRNSNPYITLCVLEDSSLEEIKRRRNKLLHIFHPDRNSKSCADESKTRKINEAYKKILNKYNETGKKSKNTKLDIPTSYTSMTRRYKRRHTLFFIIVSFLAFVGLIIAFFYINI